MSEIWLKASFVTHSFHYRMPDTVAISSVNPAMPSPLTVQMAMLASYLREGQTDKAQQLLNLLPLTVKVRPPKGAIIYRSIMRYVRPPRHASEYDSNTGSGYKISPHFREFALLSSYLPNETSSEAVNLEVYIYTTPDYQQLIAEALEQIPYLGAKDSLVSCVSIELGEVPPEDCASTAEEINLRHDMDFLVLQLANFSTKNKLFPVKTITQGRGKNKSQITQPDEGKSLTLEKLIPSQRIKEHYTLGSYVVCGELSSSGNVKLFKRRDS